jgi:hypothetical protein
MGTPLLLEELLARHLKLRVQVMHAGYPMIDNMLTLLQGQLPRLRRRRSTDLELSAQGGQPLHSEACRRWLRRPCHVRDRSVAMAQVDGIFHQHRSECGLSDAGGEARHSIQQRSSIPPARCCSN